MSYYNVNGEYIGHGNKGRIPKHLAPASMRVLNRMHISGKPGLRNKGFLELVTEANTLGITVEEVIRMYESGELT